jgi:hypothetical protein
MILMFAENSGCVISTYKHPSLNLFETTRLLFDLFEESS